MKDTAEYAQQVPKSPVLYEHNAHPLSSKQERKLMDYLDDKFLDLTRNYKKRSDPSSSLQTLSEYLTAAPTLLSLIMQIPPIDPSSPLRTTLLLRLSGEAMESITGYHPDTQVLPQLLDWLNDLDQAWLTVLRSQVWNVETKSGEDLVLDLDPETQSPPPRYTSSPMTQTERARLRSLLISGTAKMEEWLTALDTEEESYEEALERLGLQQGFDELFTETLAEMGSLHGGEMNSPVGMEGTC
ncbi:hypothetical protein C8Q75DRAFT_713702 [Abortiporus biennis]|nr:hypothetical protein C8Q75DRAFT_713702 [Abortiporus biennis]